MNYTEQQFVILSVALGLLILSFLLYKMLSNPNRYKANERRKLPYNQVPSFYKALGLASSEHGYTGLFSKSRYLIVRAINYFLHVMARILPYTKLRTPLHRMRGVKIGKNVQLGPNVFIDEAFPEYVYIEDDVAIAAGVWLIAHSKVPYFHRKELDSFVEPLVIKNNAWIATGATILPGVTIGEGSIVTAGSVVANSVPPNVMVGGVPARPIKKLGTKK